MTTLVIGALLFAAPAHATEAAGHADPVASVALWLVVILLAAKLGGDSAVRLGQPAVLGELVVGVVLGNLALVGFSGLEPIKTDPFIDMFARVGVLVLLFEVGLESTVGQMLKVGASALLVAALGVIAPFALGWRVGAWLLPRTRPLRPRLPRRHAHRDQRRHHRPRAQGPRPLAVERGARHPRRGGHRRRARARHPGGGHRRHRAPPTAAAASRRATSLWTILARRPGSWSARWCSACSCRAATLRARLEAARARRAARASASRSASCSPGSPT